jgi:hypothetical protein
MGLVHEAKLFSARNASFENPISATVVTDFYCLFWNYYFIHRFASFGLEWLFVFTASVSSRIALVSASIEFVNSDVFLQSLWSASFPNPQIGQSQPTYSSPLCLG